MKHDIKLKDLGHARFLQGIELLTLLAGLALCLLGISAFPYGGLMFALPYFFLLPGIALSFIGSLGLCFTRSKIRGKV